MPSPFSLTIANLSQPEPNLLCSGMPTESELAEAARQGIKTVINLCPLEETPPEEAEFVSRQGMTYVNIPIRGIQDLTRVQAEQLSNALPPDTTDPVLIHCKSANRVGALLALKRYWLDGLSLEEALEIGRKAGLTRLEPAVMHIMAQSAP